MQGRKPVDDRWRDAIENVRGGHPEDRVGAERQVEEIVAKACRLAGFQKRMEGTWVFYKDNRSGSQTGVFCFFVPMSF